MQLIILCGPPASGKTHFTKTITNDKVVTVSRDAIRLPLLKEGEKYFSHEKEVYRTFYTLINENLKAGNDVIADATHLNEQSRNKLIRNITVQNVDIIAINFNTSLHKCLDRNKTRAGRERIPEDVLIDMWKRFEPASHNEKYKYKEILEINE